MRRNLRGVYDEIESSFCGIRRRVRSCRDEGFGEKKWHDARSHRGNENSNLTLSLRDRVSYLYSSSIYQNGKVGWRNRLHKLVNVGPHNIQRARTRRSGAGNIDGR